MTQPAFAPLPEPKNADGADRRVGVEIEMGGLTEPRVAALCAEVLGGTPVPRENRSWHVTGTRLGDLEVMLDTALASEKKSLLRDLALDMGRDVIPVEIVTPPLAPDAMNALLPLVAALRAAGALGSGAGYTLGFGIHFNIETASEQGGDVLRPLIAYALIEDWLRWSEPIDTSRQVLPFTQPYPTAFVRALLALGLEPALGDAIGVYLEHTPSRNRGLDMLPLFAHLDATAVEAALTRTVKPRPAYHFRLPDCLIDDPQWSVTDEWTRWIIVETVARDVGLLHALAGAWEDDHGAVTLRRDSWARRCGAILRKAGIVGPGA